MQNKKEQNKKDFRLFAKKVAELGGRAFLVGGCVRDQFLGRISHDHDIVVTGLKEETFVETFPAAKQTGKSFPVFRIHLGDEEVEVAFARKEIKTGRGHNGFKVVFDQGVSLSEDLFRRDVTVNAMAEDILSGELIDPFGGQSDIEAKVLRPVSSHFGEDPLRVLRVARQAAQFGFEVSEEAIAAMRLCNDELAEVSQERIWGEMEKALSTRQPSIFFRVLRRSGSLGVVFPEIDALIGKTQPVEWHPEGDVFEHSMLVLDKLAARNADIMTRFCGLFHDVGKGATPESELPHHHFHDAVGAEIIAGWSDGRFPAKLKKAARTVASLHMRARKIRKPGKVVDLLEAIKRGGIPFESFEAVVRADCGQRVRFLSPGFIDSVLASVPIPDSVMAKGGERIKSFVHEERVKRVVALARLGWCG